MCAAHAPTCSVLHAPRASPTSDLVGEPLLCTRTTQLAIARPARARFPVHLPPSMARMQGRVPSGTSRCPRLAPSSPMLVCNRAIRQQTSHGIGIVRQRGCPSLALTVRDWGIGMHDHGTRQRVPARRPAGDCWRVPISIKLRAAYRVRRMPSGIVPSAPAGDPDWALALGRRVRAGHAEIVAGWGPRLWAVSVDVGLDWECSLWPSIRASRRTAWARASDTGTR